MKNKIRVQDVLAYARVKYQVNAANYSETLRIHNELIEEARNKWFYRKFPSLFNPSNHGLSEYDYGWHNETGMFRFEKLIQQAEYLQKCNHEYMHWPDNSSLCEDKFYEWCSQHGRPC